MSASSSAYNLSSTTSLPHHSQHANQGIESSLNISNQNSNLSMLEDDDVFSPNTGFSPSLIANSVSPNNQEAFAQFYRSIMLKSNLNSGNMSELLANNSLGNLSNLSLASDGALNTNNSANFFNMSANSSGNSANFLNQFKSNLTSNFGNNLGGNGSSTNFSPVSAFMKQKQTMVMNLRLDFILNFSRSIKRWPFVIDIA